MFHAAVDRALITKDAVRSPRRSWSLQQKAWFVTVGVLLTLAGLVAFGVDRVFREGSAELERQWVLETVRRVRASQTAEVDQLERGCRDYANWADTYAFVDDPTLPYEEKNLLPSMFANLRLNAVVIFHRDGRLRMGRTYDGTGVTDTGVDELVQVLQPFALPAIAGRSAKGFTRIHGQIAIVSLLPIVFDNGSGTPNGALAEFRSLDDDWLKGLRERLNVDIVLRHTTQAMANPESRSADSGSAGDFTVHNLSDSLMKLELPIEDLHGRRLATWEVTLERKIHLQGIRARLVFYVVLGALIVAAAALIGWLLHWLVIARLENLHAAVVRVGATSDLSVRLPLTGSDELTGLSDGFNQMLQALAETDGRRLAAEQARERLTSQLQEAQKLEAIGTLAGGLAHDFNNLITSIQGSATLIRLELGTVNPVQAHVERIEMASRRATGLVQKMTAFGRRSPTVFDDVRLTGVVRDALNLVRPSVPGGIRFEVINRAEQDLISADAGQLQQALINLATNASHAMAGGAGTLSVEICRVDLPDAVHPETSRLEPGAYLRMMVKDTGCGIPASHLARVFEPFYTTKPVGSGTGLGLAVVHGIIGNHRGSIGIKSEVGVGTTLFIHLPCSVGSAKLEAGKVAETVSQASRHTRRLLLVDDDQLVRTAVEAGLRRMGYAVTTAESGAGALQLFSANPEAFDLLITDQMMPGMTGMELGQRLDRLRPTLPRILLTGYAAAINEPTVKASGFSCMLMKPVTLEELTQAIDRALRSVTSGLASAGKSVR